MDLEFTRRVGAVLLALFFAMNSGCGRSDLPELAPVQGIVTYQGKPLDHGMVIFTAEEGTPGPQADGSIQSDGTFRMQLVGNDGAPVGKHVVTVHCRRPATEEEKRNLVVTELLIPEKYSRVDQTPLQFEVKSGTNALPIELQ